MRKRNEVRKNKAELLKEYVDDMLVRCIDYQIYGGDDCFKEDWNRFIDWVISCIEYLGIRKYPAGEDIEVTFVQENRRNYLIINGETITGVDVLPFSFSKEGSFDFCYALFQDKTIAYDMIYNYILINQIKSNIKKCKPKYQQFTYLMIDENTGLTKIGISINPVNRERTLQSEKPTIIMFAAREENIEKILHKEYNVFRIRGEWFKLNQNQIENIIKEYNFEIVSENASRCVAGAVSRFKRM